MTKLKVAFRNFSQAPKDGLVPCDVVIVIGLFSSPARRMV